MKERIIKQALPSLLIAVAVYLVQWRWIVAMQEVLPFSITAMYIFHLVAYLILIAGVEVLVKRLPAQVGFFYLASVFLKIGLFVLIFSDVLARLDDLNKFSRLHILLPFALFLTIEAIYCGRLMNRL
jgi:hypothetical protein